VPSFRTGTVTELVSQREGLQRLAVDGESAYALTEIVGLITLGDKVVINTTAVELGLGTGGDHVVHWNLARSELVGGGRGHIMKLRYTSEQSNIGAWEETRDQPPDRLPDLSGLPVLACSLHSHVGAIALGIKHRKPGLSIGYAMTDGGALPLAHSDLMAELRERGVISRVATAGHAFGGDLEAVNAASAVEGLSEARVDVVLLGIGPGHVGTATRLGFSSLDLVGPMEIAGALGARVALAARASSLDARARHIGLSHHTQTVMDVLGRRVEVPLPPGLAVESGIHTVTHIDPVNLADATLGFSVEVTSMGRRLADDDLGSACVGAAAAWAAAAASTSSS
jgi:hypothetical protein